MSIAVLLSGCLAHGAVIGIDGKPLSGSYDPTKCKLDREDDQFKDKSHGGQCARCLTNDQCRDAYGSSRWYCCPFMKRCVNSGSMGCYDTAYCNPRCFNEKYPELKAECTGCSGSSDFPDRWIKSCTRDEWSSLVTSTTVVEESSEEESSDQGGSRGEVKKTVGGQDGVIPATSLGGRTSSDPENIRDSNDKCWEVSGASYSSYNDIYVPCAIAVVKKFFPRYDNYRCWMKRFHDKGLETAYADPVMVFSWKWFIPAAFPKYESFNKQEPIDWEVNRKWGSGKAPIVKQVTCSDVDFGYVCENNGCSRSGTEGRDYGFFSRTDGDCESCVKQCSENSDTCGSVECGPTVGHCMWWKHGKCESGGSSAAFTCRRYTDQARVGPSPPTSGPSPTPKPTPRPIPTPKPTSRPIPTSKPTPTSDSDDSQGHCGEIGADGLTCRDTNGCEWDWDLYSCVKGDSVSEKKADEEKSGCLDLEGPACIAKGGCTWDWSDGCIAEEQGRCQKIGADGPTCMTTHGCRWDWSTFVCSPVETDVDNEKGTESCKGATTARKCKKLSGCTFDKASKVCKIASKVDEVVVDEKCSGLGKKTCRKTSGCTVSGSGCVPEAAPAPNGSGETDAHDVCSGMRRSKCIATVSCKYDKKQKRCSAK